LNYTIKQLAESLNLSVTTVSRALNGKGRISDETTARVVEAAKRLQYSPNDMARNLKLNISKTIGVILPDTANIFFMLLLRGVERYARTKGYNVLVCNSDEDVQLEEKYFLLLSKKSVCGMIVSTVGAQSIYSNIDMLGRVVFVNARPSQENCTAIHLDNCRCAYRIVEKLIQNGHRKIAMITGEMSYLGVQDRADGYLQCLRDYGIPINQDYIKYANYHFRVGYNAMNEILQLADRPTAIYFHNNTLAYEGIKAIRDNGMDVPKDFSIVCFDSIDETGLLKPQITNIQHPVEEMGRLAAEILIDCVDNNRSLLEKSRDITLDPIFIEGETCRTLKE
jgi:DNA-binding LacI/PurR family transcriptional regulator